ncbi:putative reverse transcriptase domain-containing protein, partial [Tanacetum coccineum]
MSTSCCVTMTVECVTYGVFTLQESVERAMKALARTNMSLLKAIKRQKLTVSDFDYDSNKDVSSPNVDKTEIFWPKEDPRSRLAGIFPPHIARPSHGVKLLGGPASVNFDFCNDLVMKRVAKTIGLMDAIAKINNPQCELLLLRSCAGISRLYFTMRTCPPRVFESAQRSFDVSAGLQTKLLRHTGIVSPGPNFDDALSVFNISMETDLLSSPSILLFSVLKPCSRVFARDIYGDHVVSCVVVIGIKHRHNVQMCYFTLSGYGGLDVCVDDWSSTLSKQGMVDFVPGQAVIDATQRKRDKYMAKCTAIGYGFLPFSFSSLGELEADAVTLLKRIRKFSMAQDIGARAAVHIFNRISFAIAKGEIGARAAIHIFKRNLQIWSLWFPKFADLLPNFTKVQAASPKRNLCRIHAPWQGARVQWKFQFPLHSCSLAGSTSAMKVSNWGGHLHFREVGESHDAEDHREDIDIQEMLNRGKNWSVALGRRDGVTTNLKAANMYMSSPFEPVANITVKFATIGLDIKDFVALSADVERAWPLTTSCVDILTLATREAVFL